jgi:hypothetical protein
MIEAALLIPVLILIAGALFTLGVRLSNYMYLNQIGRELVLQMATTRCLANFFESGSPAVHTYEVGPSQYNPAPQPQSWADQCSGEVSPGMVVCPSTASGCPLDLVQYYGSLLVKSKPLILDGNVTMKFSFAGPASDPTSVSGICIVRVEFEATDIGWLGYLGGPLRTVSEAPYTSVPMPGVGTSCQCPSGGC